MTTRKIAQDDAQKIVKKHYGDKAYAVACVDTERIFWLYDGEDEDSTKCHDVTAEDIEQIAHRLTKTDKKHMAQKLIMRQIAKIGYGAGFEDFAEQIGDIDEATAILKEQMDRAARLFGFDEAWFY